MNIIRSVETDQDKLLWWVNNLLGFVLLHESVMIYLNIEWRKPNIRHLEPRLYFGVKSWNYLRVVASFVDMYEDEAWFSRFLID